MKKKISLAVLAALLIALAVAGGYGYYYYSKYVDIDTIYPGVKIEGMDVGGMTGEDARTLIDEYVSSVSEQKVTLQMEDKSKSFLLSKMGLTSNADDVLKEACGLGRDGNIIHRIMEVRSLAEAGADIPLQFSVDEDASGKIFKKKAKKLEAKKKNAAITRKNGKFKVTPEVDGISIDYEANVKRLIDIITSSEWDQKAVVFPVDFKKDEAEHTAEELSVIKDSLGTFTTTYYDSSSSRCRNIEVGASKLDGIVLYPGETLSVHDKVAPLNKENGYELAGSYLNGETVQSYGGGMCQVSTTLYNAVLRAELEIKERHNHSMTVAYVPLSQDAAIAGTEKDLKFTNSLKNPVYIDAKAGGRSITFTIYGKEYRKKKRTIEFVSERLSTTYPPEKIIKDDTMEEGKEKIESRGHTGYTARLWKVIYVNGKEKDRVQINSSSYMATKTVIRRGTKPKKTAQDKKKNKKNNQKAEDGAESPEDTGTTAQGQ